MAETQSKLKASPQHGTSVDELDSEGVSRLMRASANRDTQTVKSLLDEGAQVNLKDNKGVCALHRACSGGLALRDDRDDWVHYRFMPRLNDQSDTVKVLLDHGAQVDSQDKNGVSALMVASFFGLFKTVHVLLDHGAQVDFKEESRWSALMIASYLGHTEVVRVLLDHGAQVDLQMEKEISALMYASCFGHIEVVRVLLDHGAQVDLQDEYGASALKVAQDEGHHEVVQLLLDHGAGDKHGSHDSAASGPSEHDKPVKLPQRTDSEMSPQEETSVILEKHTAQITENKAQITENKAQITENTTQITENTKQITESKSQVTENTTQINQLKAMFASMQLKFGNLQPIKNNPSHYPTSLTPRDVYRELLPLASKWNKIGILLNIKPEQLDTIKSNNPEDVEDCLLETIKGWLNGIDPRPTWEELVEAVKPFNENKAEDIRIKYCTQ